MSANLNRCELVVVGSGPAGLSCAIEAKRARLSCVVLEKGSLADAIRRFPVNTTFFSTPDLLEIGGVPFLSSGFRPTRGEVVRYYQKVADVHGLDVAFERHVEGIGRDNGGFEVRTNKGRYRAGAVVVATGYFDRPRPFVVPGSDLPKVIRFFDEGSHYFRRRVAVVGGRNSAVETALDLFRCGARVTLIHRGSDLSEGVKYWILPDIENRIRSGEITALFNGRVMEVRADSIIVDQGKSLELPNDYLFVMIGYEPDITLLAQAGAGIDADTLAPLHNPDTMETTVKGLYVAGSIGAGRHNNKIFIENGRMHGERIVKSLTNR